jgi:phthalate 4,5-dioxygenase oxygenase subunit
MLSKEENELLTGVGPGAPMGELMKQHWVPALRSARLEADDAPVRVKLFNENYVAFRATDGRVGFLDEGCPHRGVSLALGRNEDCAIRCIFHGWKIDVSGTVVEVPSEPAGSNLASKIKVNHYPVRESAGLVWVWLGKGATPPPFPNFDFNNLPPENVRIVGAVTKVSWLQGLEAVIDSSHLSALHSGSLRESNLVGQTTTMLHDTAPRFEVEQEPYGLKVAAIRNTPDGSQYARVTQYIFPFYSRVAGDGSPNRVQFAFIPIDDTSSITWFIQFNLEKPYEVSPQADHAFFGTTNPDLDNFYNWGANPENMWGQDRQRMKGGHYSGMSGINPEDFACQESQGPIVDRTVEKLGSSDIGIIRARKLLIDSARAFAEGKPPFGVDQAADYNRIDSIGEVYPKDGDWRNLFKTPQMTS